MAVAVILVLMSGGISYQLWESWHAPDKFQTGVEDPLTTRYREDLEACRTSLTVCGRRLQLAKKNLARAPRAASSAAFQPVAVIKDESLGPDTVVNSSDKMFALSFQSWDEKQRKAVLVITPNADQKPVHRPLGRTESFKFKVGQRSYSLLVTTAGPKSVTVSVTRYQ
jgi:hypothetical protein